MTRQPAIRSGVTQKQVQRNLGRIAKDLPGFYQRRQARVDLRRKLLDQQYASHHQHEYEKLLGHYSGIMGPNARAEDLKLRAREHAQKLFGHMYHGS
jgi:hypothetical protein